MTYKIVITGANGMLGSALCKVYHENHQIYAFHRDSKCYPPCTKDYNLDLTSKGKLEWILHSIKPDLVIHCAALINLDLCEEKPEFAYNTNVVLTENVLKACPEGTKFIYISTDQVYGKAIEYSEDNIDLKPGNQYGMTKLQGEKKVQEYFADHIVIRTNIFGWNMKPGRISFAEWVHNSLVKGEKITLFTDYLFSPIYTKYFANIILQLVRIGFSGLINVGSPEPCSKYEFGIHLASEFGFVDFSMNKGSINNHIFNAPRNKDLTIKTKKLIGLGIEAPSYEESIKLFIKDLTY